MSAPTDNPILTTSLRWGGIFALIVAVLSSGVGLLVAGLPGLWAALVATALAVVFLGLTAASMILASRMTPGDPGSPVYFGVVLGVFTLKLVVFFILAIWLRTQTWLDPWVFFGTVIVIVMGSLVIDALAFQRSRVLYVQVKLPGDQDSDESAR
jgi:hypothetical protein